MIKIQKSSSNTLVFTLNEKTTDDPVYYLLELYSNQNHNSKVVALGLDNSPNQNRWNEFIIIEDDVEDLANGTISLEATTYDYFVWQTPVISLDLNDATSIVESGKCVVRGADQVTFTYEDDNDEYTFN